MPVSGSPNGIVTATTRLGHLAHPHNHNSTLTTFRPPFPYAFRLSDMSSLKLLPGNDSPLDALLFTFNRVDPPTFYATSLIGALLQCLTFGCLIIVVSGFDSVIRSQTHPDLHPLEHQILLHLPRQGQLHHGRESDSPDHVDDVSRQYTPVTFLRLITAILQAQLSS